MITGSIFKKAPISIKQLEAVTYAEAQFDNKEPIEALDGSM